MDRGRLPDPGWLPVTVAACLLAGGFFLPFVPLLPGVGQLFPELRIWDRQRSLQGGLLLAGLAMFVIALMVRGRPLSLSRHLLIGWATIAMISLLSAALAHYPRAALLDWAWMQALFALALLAAWLFRRRAAQAAALWLVPSAIASLLYVFWFFVINSDQFFSYDFREVRPMYPGFSNLRYFSDFHALLVFLAPLAVDRYLSGKRERMLGWTMVGLLYALAFVAGARSMLAGQLVAHAGLWLVLRAGYLPLLRLYLFSWLLGLLLYVPIFHVYAPWSVAQGAPDTVAAGAAPIRPALVLPRVDSSGRSELAIKAFRLIADSPWLGVGGRHYGCYVKADYRDPNNPENGDAVHPHNAVLQLFAEWGSLVALGVGGLFGWLLLALAKSLKRDRQAAPERHLAYAVSGALLALSTHAMVTGVLNAPVSQMLLVLLIGWSMARVVPEPAAESRRSLRVTVGVLVVALAVGGGWLFATEWRQLPEANRWYLDEMRVTWYLSPRFWQQGWLVPLCGKV